MAALLWQVCSVGCYLNFWGKLSLSFLFPISYLLSVGSSSYMLSVLFSEPKQRVTRKSILELSHKGIRFSDPWRRKPFLYSHKESSKHTGNSPQETQDDFPY